MVNQAPSRVSRTCLTDVTETESESELPNAYGACITRTVAEPTTATNQDDLMTVSIRD